MKSNLEKKQQWVMNEHIAFPLCWKEIQQYNKLHLQNICQWSNKVSEVIQSFLCLMFKALNKGCVISVYFNLHNTLELPSGDTSVNTEALKSMSPIHHKGFNCLHSRQPVRQTRAHLELNRLSISNLHEFKPRNNTGNVMLWGNVLKLCLNFVG